MPEESFDKSRRLLNAWEFQRVFDNNSARVSRANLLLLALPNDMTRSRMGLVVAKKNIPDAVSRNRLKRVARETFRRTRLTTPVDVVVLARRGLDKLSPAAQHELFKSGWQELERRLG